MSQSISNKLMTADELWRMPNDHMRHELVRGELTTMAPAGADHGRIGARILRLVDSHVDQHKLGHTFNADTGFYLSRSPDTVRAPDISFVSMRRVPAAGLPQKFFEGAPDLAVEVLSPSDTVEETEDKIAEYFEAGCLMVWIVTPKRKTVTVHRPDQQPRVFKGDDTITGEDVLAGFECRVSDFFA
jgi:Uma2 family endonuclease